MATLTIHENISQKQKVPFFLLLNVVSFADQASAPWYAACTPKTDK